LKLYLFVGAPNFGLPRAPENGSAKQCDLRGHQKSYQERRCDEPTSKIAKREICDVTVSDAAQRCDAICVFLLI
jgi:hypothetical protein